MNLAFYDGLKEGLLAQRKEIRALTRHTKIQGDYSEAIIRDFVQKTISSRLKVGYGLVYSEKGHSRECDVIVYKENKKPFFKSTNSDLVVIDTNDVEFVMQVKSKLTSSSLKRAISNLETVKNLEPRILCWVVGFETDVYLKTLYLNAWKSKVVHFLIALTRSDDKEDELMKYQMKFFRDLLRLYTKQKDESTMPPSYVLVRNGLIIYGDEKRKTPIALLHNLPEQKIKKVLSDIDSKGFWELWESDYNIYTV